VDRFIGPVSFQSNLIRRATGRRTAREGRVIFHTIVVSPDRGPHRRGRCRIQRCDGREDQSVATPREHRLTYWVDCCQCCPAVTKS
jgi:hypothetical protein